MTRLDFKSQERNNIIKQAPAVRDETVAPNICSYHV